MAKLAIKKRVKNLVVYENGMFRLDNVRASYPHLGRPYVGKTDDGKDAKPKYSITLLVDKKTHSEAITEIKAVIEAIIREKKVKLASDNRFLKDGDVKYDHKEECIGKYVINTSETKRPVVRDAEGVEIEDKDEVEETIYGGCYVSVLIAPWYQDNSFGKKVNANIRAVKFCKDGEPFGEGRINDEDLWDDEEGGEGFDDDEDI